MNHVCGKWQYAIKDSDNLSDVAPLEFSIFKGPDYWEGPSYEGTAGRNIQPGAVGHRPLAMET